MGYPILPISREYGAKNSFALGSESQGFLGVHRQEFTLNEVYTVLLETHVVTPYRSRTQRGVDLCPTPKHHLVQRSECIYQNLAGQASRAVRRSVTLG